jgi:hypothetical protein
MQPEERASLANQVHAALDQANRVDGQRQASGLALQIIRENTDPTGQVNEGAAFKALNAHFAPEGKLAARPELWDDANRILNQGIGQAKAQRQQALGELGGAALDEFMGIDASGKPHMSFLNVRPQTQAGLRALGKDGEEVLAQLVRWDQANDMHERNRRQLPSPSEDARALAIERSLRRDPEVYRKMPTAQLLAVLTGKAPVPGEPDAPAVSVSSRDLPKLRDMLGANAAAPSAIQVTSPETIAQQEFERSFGLGKMPSKRWSPAQREALTKVTDEVARWVNSERAGGRHPTDDQIRAHLTAPGGLLHKLDRKTMLGFPYGPRSPLEQQMNGGGAPSGELVPNDPTKPIIENPDGTFSTERTMSFRDEDGKETVIATIVGGTAYSPKEAVRLYREGKNPALGKFDTVSAAEEYAQQRHLKEERTRAGDRARRQPAANSAQVPLGLRGRIRDDFKAMYPGREFTAADLVRGYNAGLAAGEF